MESFNQTYIVKDSEKSDKVKKNKKKVKKFTFFRGTQNYKCPKADISQDIREIFQDLITRNPNYIFHNNQRKYHEKPDGPKRLKIERTQNPLKQELIFGLKSILRKVPKNELIGVCLTDPISIHLQQTLYESCKETNIPFLLVPNLASLKSILNISSLTCFGFTKKVLELESICSDLFNLFKKNAINQYDQFTIVQQSKSLLQEPETKVDKLFRFILPSPEEMYIPVIQSSSELLKVAKQENFSTESSLIKLTKTEEFFPNRSYYFPMSVSISLTSKSTDENDIKFGRNLFQNENEIENNKFPSPSFVSLVSSGKQKIHKKQKIFLTKKTHFLSKKKNDKPLSNSKRRKKRK